MALLIYSGQLLITGVQIKAFNEAGDEVLRSRGTFSREPRGVAGEGGGGGSRTGLLVGRSPQPVYSYFPVMKCLYAAA